VCCKTVIGQGSPNKAGTHDVHGAALGSTEAAATRAALGWSAAPFEIAADIRAAWDARAEGAARQGEWQRRMDAYAQAYPQLAAEFQRRVVERALPQNWPAASAAATCPTKIASGKFHGEIHRKTPRPRRRTWFSSPVGPGIVSTTPYNFFASTA